MKRINIVLNDFPSPSETFLKNFILGIGADYEVGLLVFSDKYKKDFSSVEYGYTLKYRVYPGKTWYRAVLSLCRQGYFFIKKIFGGKGSDRWRKAIKGAIAIDFLTWESPALLYFTYSALAVGFEDVLEDIKGHGIKLVLSCRGTSENVKPLLYPNRRTSLVSVLEKMDLVHCVSQAMVNRLRKYGYSSEKTFVNYPAVDIQYFSPEGKKEPRRLNQKIILLSTGRLHYIKGYIHALDAIAELVAEGILLEYRIIGDGPEKEFLTFYISDRGLSEYVSLLGVLPIEQVRMQLQIADIFLLSSYAEGVSNAVLEAMAMEIPVVCTRVGGMEEVITDGYDGMLATPYDTISIARAIRAVSASEEKAIAIGKNARRKIISSFNLELQRSIFKRKIGELFNG